LPEFRGVDVVTDAVDGLAVVRSAERYRRHIGR